MMSEFWNKNFVQNNKTSECLAEKERIPGKITAIRKINDGSPPKTKFIVFL